MNVMTKAEAKSFFILNLLLISTDYKRWKKNKVPKKMRLAKGAFKGKVRTGISR
jgi:hypothetical protein